MGVHNIMLGHTLVFLLLAILHSAVAQFREADFVKFPAPDFICPEPNGRFPDAEQCDKYYICKKDVAEAVLCPEGLLFDFKVPNHEKCVYPHGVDCSGRNLIQELTPGIDPRCGAAWGYFEYFDEVQNKTDCTKYWNCDNGVAHEMPCVQSLYFDYIKGTCVRLDDMTAEQQDVCNDDNLGVKSIDGWTCPPTADPSFPATLERTPTSLVAVKVKSSMLISSGARIPQRCQPAAATTPRAGTKLAAEPEWSLIRIVLVLN